MAYRKRITAWLLAVSLIVFVGTPCHVYAFESNPKNEKANTFLMAENYREALSLYEKTLEEDSNDFEAGFGRAMCLVRLKRYYLALEQLSGMQGTDEEELLKISDSVRLIKQTLATHPNEDVISYYRNLIVNEDSFSAMDVMLHEYPDYPATEYYRTMLYREIFTYDFCKEMNQDILDNLGAYYKLALEEYPWQEEFSNAYTENLAIRIDNAFAQGDLEQADTLITSAVAYEPQNVKFLLSKGELFFEQGQYEETKQIMEQVISVNPEIESAYGFMMRCYDREKDYGNAITMANQLLSINPDNVYGYAYLYRANQKLNNKEAGSLSLLEIENYQGDEYDKACAFALAGKYDRAVLTLESAINHNPETMFYAKYDDDLKPLHIRRQFRELVQENYTEELSDYYAALILGIGALLSIVLLLDEWLKKKKNQKAVYKMLLFLTVFLCGLLKSQEVSAKNYKLREQETRQLFAKEEETGEAGNSTADLCCENELEWLLENIEINERTLTPLMQNDAEKAALLNESATVNVQSLRNGSVCGQGSGVIVGFDNEKITIIGCRHTLYTDNLRIRFGNGDSAKAELLGKSENYDFMVLRVAVKDLFIETKNYLKRVNIDYAANARLAPGDEAVSNGFVSTKGFIYYTGEITNLRKTFSNFKPYYTNHVPYVLTSTKAEAGSSGGGTFDGYGNFIGLQAGIVLATGERYVVPFDIIAEEYRSITGESLE